MNYKLIVFSTYVYISPLIGNRYCPTSTLPVGGTPTSQPQPFSFDVDVGDYVLVTSSFVVSNPSFTWLVDVPAGTPAPLEDISGRK